jgi:TPR repeat protein
VPQNYAEAAKWYRKGAQQGNARGQKNLGALYEAGHGVPEDWIVAALWYQKSAAQGNAEGQAALARAYMFGMGDRRAEEMLFTGTKRQQRRATKSPLIMCAGFPVQPTISGFGIQRKGTLLLATAWLI